MEPAEPANLGRQSLSDLPQNLPSAWGRNIWIYTSALFKQVRRRSHALRKIVYASRVLPRASWSSWGVAVFTRARVSPVVGQTDLKISPEPLHCPSYTPESSSVVEIPSEERMFEARLDKPRVKRVVLSLEIARFATIMVLKMLVVAVVSKSV